MMLILIDAGVYMLMPTTSPYDFIGRGTLALAGQAFILAAYYQAGNAPRGRNVLIPVAVSGALNVAFQLAATANSSANSQAASWWYYPLIALGVVSTLWLIGVDRTADRRGKSLSVVLIVVAYALQAAMSAHYGPLMASQWLMCWTYMAAGFMFVRQTTQLSIRRHIPSAITGAVLQPVTIGAEACHVTECRRRGVPHRRHERC